MRKLLRWAGLAISISAYAALTIWTNTLTGHATISQGESATRAGMQPFWILVFIGVGIFFASWFVRRGRPEDHGSVEMEQMEKGSEPSSTISTSQSDRPSTPPSHEEMRRAARHLRGGPERQPPSATNHAGSGGRESGGVETGESVVATDWGSC